jgi:hypothetical protein
MIKLKGRCCQCCKIFLGDIEDGVIELIQNILNIEISEGVQLCINLILM